MAESTFSQWTSAFDDLVIDLEPTAAPQGRSGEWFQAHAEFSRHSFARVLLSAENQTLHVRVEIALGPPEGDAKTVASALSDRWGAITETDWDAACGETPWLYETTLSSDDGDHVDRLRRLLMDIIAICERFEAITEFDEWRQFLLATDAAEDLKKPPETSSHGPGFEEIGGSSSSASSNDATIESATTASDGDKLLVVLNFSEILAHRQVRALQDGLEHHLHTKFDVQARPVDDDERLAEYQVASARTVLGLEVTPGGFEGSPKSLQGELDGFLERLEKFSSFGVDLFEYLGVGETVFDEASEASQELDEARSQLSFRRRAPSSAPRPGEEVRGNEDGVVLDLGGATATSSTSLEAKNYTDPRLQRQDSDAALVDLVLRHPGYSDRRIGQVLSILLSIEYHAAIDIADAAPCVIAWGLGQQRARSFKEILESAGGKALLVEPGTFGEA